MIVRVNDLIIFTCHLPPSTHETNTVLDAYRHKAANIALAMEQLGGMPAGLLELHKEEVEILLKYLEIQHRFRTTIQGLVETVGEETLLAAQTRVEAKLMELYDAKQIVDWEDSPCPICEVNHTKEGIDVH